jgi:tetratricopeptide (TPR) repeat protein
MRKLLAAIVALALLLCSAALPVRADPYVDNAALDELFDELKQASNETDAAAIGAQIWRYWFTPNNDELSFRMAVASQFMSEGNYVDSLAAFDGIVADFPDYAEGWNQRATLLFLMGRFDDSLADIDKVLDIEPRHFGAISGRVLIYMEQGKRDLALKEMIAALAIHPYLGQRRMFPELANDVTHV